MTGKNAIEEFVSDVSSGDSEEGNKETDKKFGELPFTEMSNIELVVINEDNCEAVDLNEDTENDEYDDDENDDNELSIPSSPE